MICLTTGYGRGTPDQLLALADKHEAQHVVDIRISVKSVNRPEWTGEAVRRLLGPRYVHVRELGNAARFQSGEIQIADYPRGRDRLTALGGSALLFCACGKADACHRSWVAGDLEMDGHIVREVAWPKIPPVPGWIWNRTLGRHIPDKLAEMERYAERHTLTEEQAEKLAGLRWLYWVCEGCLIRYLADGMNETDCRNWNQDNGNDARVTDAVIARLKQSKQWKEETNETGSRSRRTNDPKPVAKRTRYGAVQSEPGEACSIFD